MGRRGNPERPSRWGAFVDVGVWLLFFANLVPAGFVGYVIGKEQAEDDERAAATAPLNTDMIEPAPAFSAEDLAAEPSETWITNNGSLANRRYSPLDQIDTDNVQDLRGVWMTDLGGSCVAAKYSAEAQPIGYQGVLYVPTGADDVFAVRVADGEILWRYEAKLDQMINDTTAYVVEEIAGG